MEYKNKDTYILIAKFWKEALELQHILKLSKRILTQNQKKEQE